MKRNACKTSIHKLIGRLAAGQRRLAGWPFLAPCVRGGRVRTRIEGLVCTFAPEPGDFEGWGIFEASDERTARLTEPAGLAEVERYLALFESFRLRLVDRLRGQSWLASGVNESDLRQRLGAVGLRVVHLVGEGRSFESITARFDGGAFWFEAMDRRADPTVAERLALALREEQAPEELRFAGLTPEMRTAYQLLYERRKATMKRWRERSDERRLQQTLKTGGGELVGFSERGDYWQVDWSDRDGITHTSAIGKRDLTVLSAGICLSGQDRRFDLQSLVGVVEQRDEW